MTNRTGSSWRFSLLVVGLMPSVALAQETFFNVPSAEVSPEGALYVQQQVGWINHNAELDTQATYGLGWDTEIGLNVLNVNLGATRQRGLFFDVNHDDPADPYGPVLGPSLQKSVTLSPVLQLNGGGQLHVNVGGPLRDTRVAVLGYLNVAFHLPETENRLVLGVYQGNAYRLGEPASFGFWAGGSVELIENRFQLEGEFISGTHGFGAVIAGPRLFLTDEVSLGAGFVAPNPGREERIYGALLQLELTGLLGSSR